MTQEYYFIPICGKCEGRDLPFGTVMYRQDSIKRVGICRRHALERLESQGKMSFLEWWELQARRYGLALLIVGIALYFAAHVAWAFWTKAWPIRVR